MVKRQTESDKQLYLEERKMFVGLLQSSANTLDKHMFLLASGSILLSTTFLEKIVGKDVVYPGLLILSWSFLVLGLISVLISFYASGKACHRSIEILDHSFSNIPDRSINRWSVVTDVLNILSIVTIITGVVLLTVFSFKNIIK